PLLPLAKRPLASWPLLGVCAALSVGRGADMGVTPERGWDSGIVRRGPCAPSVLIIRGGTIAGEGSRRCQALARLGISHNLCPAGEFSGGSAPLEPRTKEGSRLLL